MVQQTVLNRLCALEVGEQDDAEGWEKLPRNWPDHLRLDVVSRHSTTSILLALKFSLKELLMGIAVYTPRRGPKEATRELNADDWLMRHNSTWMVTRPR